MPSAVPDNHPLRQAKWIWPAALFEAKWNLFAQFRRDFDIDAVPTLAPLHITADQSYMLWVNGTYAGRGPARGFQMSWPFDTIDVAHLLCPGRNWISVRVYNPGRGLFYYRHEDAAGLLMAADWGASQLVTDDTWSCRVDPSHARLTPVYNFRLPNQEHVDLRLDDGGWITEADWTPPAHPQNVARDDFGTPVGRWDAPVEVRPYGMSPWHMMETRDLPMLTDEVVSAKVVASAAGQAAATPGKDPIEDFNRDFADPDWSTIEADDETTCEVPALLAGEARAIVFDLSRPDAGTPRLELTGTAEGQLVDLVMSQTLLPTGGIDVGRDNNALAARLVCAGGETTWENHHLVGYRYAAVVLRGPSPATTVRHAVRSCVYPLDIVGRFESDNDQVNAIYQTSRNTQRVCMLDAYIDTPWRELAQWWGDARVQFQSTVHLGNDSRLLRRGIRQIARQSLPNGLTYGHAPTIAHNCVLPDFTLIWCITLWDHYWQTGSPELFEQHRGQVYRALDYFAGEGRDEATGLLKFDERYWLFLDWSDRLHNTGCPALLNLWYVDALAKLGECADAAGMAEADELRTAAELHAAKCVAAFWDEKEGLFSDGLDDEGRPVEMHSIHTQTLAARVGLPGVKSEDVMRRRVVPYLRGEDVPGAKPSAYWVTYVYDAAREAGFGHAALDHLIHHWAPMIADGGTWETFNTPADPTESRSHAWSAHPIYHLPRLLGGIVQTDAAWEAVRIAPLVAAAQVSNVEATVPTPHGPLTVTWRREGRHAHIEADVPAGVTADVVLPKTEDYVSEGLHAWDIALAEDPVHRDKDDR